MVATHRGLRRGRRPFKGWRQPLIWREALVGLDWLSLRLSPVYLGVGVPRGDGSPVVLVPGFFSVGAHLLEMYLWLRRIGYSPFLSSVGINVDCMQVLTQWLENTVVDVHEETGKPVRLIGYSLGGLVARRVALTRPEIVSQLISLGTPIRAMEAHPSIMSAAGFLRKSVEPFWPAKAGATRGLGICHTERCECLADQPQLRYLPPSVHHAALFSHSDGVIPWRNCLEPEPALNYEVGGSHIGLVFNPRAYRIIAGLLAEASAESRRAA